MLELQRSVCAFCFKPMTDGSIYAHQKCIDKAAKEEADDNRQTKE
ncbi:hypothetical protein [Yersinia enterocolitica]